MRIYSAEMFLYVCWGHLNIYIKKQQKRNIRRRFFSVRTGKMALKREREG